jgi:hypothetical protein
MDGLLLVDLGLEYCITTLLRMLVGARSNDEMPQTQVPSSPEYI